MEDLLKQVLDKLAVMDRKIDDKFEQIDQRFEQIDRRFEEIDQRFELIEENLKVVTKHVAKINENQVVLMKDFNNYVGLVNFHAVKIDRLEYEVMKLKEA